MVDAATNFRKNGYGDEDSAQLAYVAAMFSNVADEAISAGESADFIISQLIAFNIQAEDSMRIIDAVNEVANSYAVSSGQLASGLKVVASSSAAMGNSFEETLGLLVSITEQTRNASKAARGVNAIMANLASVLDDASSNGAKIKDIYTDLGLSMEDTNGQLLSGYELLEKLSQKWNTLDGNTQKYIATTIAGTTQLNNFFALMNNFSHAAESTTAALEAAGSAEEENARYMGGLEAKTQELKATFEELANKVINSDLVKSLLNIANSLLKFVATPMGATITKTLLLSSAFLGASQLSIRFIDGLRKIGSTAVNTIKNLGKTADAATKVGTAIKNAGNASDKAEKQTDKFSSTLSTISVVGTAVVGVITFVVSAIQEYQDRLAQVRENIIAQGTEAKNTLDSLNDLTERYDTLKYAQEHGEDVSNELTDVTKQLTNHFKDQGIIIKDLIGIYGNFENALKGAGEEERAILEQDIKAAKVAAEQALTSAVFSLRFTFFDNSENAIAAAAQAVQNESPGLSQAETVIAIYNKLYEIQGRLLNNSDDVNASVFGGYEQVTAALDKLRPLVEAYNLATQNEAEIVNDRTSGYYSYLEMMNNYNGEVIKTNEIELSRTEIINEQISAIEGLKNAFSVITSAFAEVSEEGTLAYATLKDISEQFSDVDGIDSYVDALLNTKLTSEELREVLTSLIYAKADQIVTENGLTEETYNLIEAMLREAGVVNSAAVATAILSNKSGLTTQQLYLLAQSANVSGKSIDQVRQYANLLSNTGLDVSSILAGLNNITNTAAGAYSALYQLKVLAAGGSSAYFKQQYEETSPGSGIWVPKGSASVPTIDFPTSSGKTSGGGGSSKTTDTRLEALKSNVSLLESQLTLLEKQNKPISEQVAKNKEIQAALHEQAEHMRSIGASEEEINDLAVKWWSIQSDINELLKEAMDIIKEGLQEEADNIENAFSYAIKMAEAEIDKINDKYDKQLETLEDSNDELEKQITLEEKLKAIAEAKAKKLYVYKDGRFQYVDDVEAISAAQKDYDDYLRQQQLETQKDAIENARNAELKVWENYIKNWENVVDGYTDAQDRLLAEQVLGIQFEKDNWAERLGNAEEFARKYADIMSQISQIESMQASSQYVDLSTDYSALMDKATTAEEFNKYAALRDAKATALGIDIKGSGYRSNEEIRKQKGFASGTLSAPYGLSLVGERGPELRVLNSGDGIIPSDITRNLWNWGKIDPNAFMKNQNYTFNIDHLALPGVTDAQSFLTGLKQMAYQRAYKRA